MFICFQDLNPPANYSAAFRRNLMAVMVSISFSVSCSVLYFFQSNFHIIGFCMSYIKGKRPETSRKISIAVR